MVCGKGILEKADGGDPEPAKGRRFLQGSAGPATRALQMVEHSQQQTVLAEGLTAETMPAEEEVEDRRNDSLSRSTRVRPKRWPALAMTERTTSRRLRSAKSGRDRIVRLSTACRRNHYWRQKGGEVCKQRWTMMTKSEEELLQSMRACHRCRSRARRTLHRWLVFQVQGHNTLLQPGLHYPQRD